MATYTIGQVLEDVATADSGSEYPTSDEDSAESSENDSDYEEEQDRGRRRGARPLAGPERGELDIGRGTANGQGRARGEAVNQQGTWQDVMRGMLRATQYSNQCFCGDERNFLNLGDHRPESECNRRCSGDSNEMCGGAWRMSVYSTNYSAGTSSTPYGRTTSAFGRGTLGGGHQQAEPPSWSASSEFDSRHSADRADINTRETADAQGGWSAATNNKDQWLMRDLGDVTDITGVITKGRNSGRYDQYVTSYIISYGNENGDETFYTDADGKVTVFPANDDRDTAVNNDFGDFSGRITARFVKIHPQTWHVHISMRAKIVTANPQWLDVFSTMKGTGQTVYDAWRTNGQVSHNKCPVVDRWESLNIQRVKVVLESEEGNVELIFDGRNTDKFNWFSKSRLLSSPWNDISTEPQNIFSIRGTLYAKRSFYINRNWGGCSKDAGWLAVADGGPLRICEWEQAPKDQLPYIRFSKTTGYANYNGGDIVTADRMVIYIDTPGNNVLCSCPAGQSLSEDGTRCEDADTETAFACEWSTLQLSCSDGEKLLIVDANYGRTSATHPCSNFRTKCRTHNYKSLAVVRAACQGNRQCRVTASNSVFGDPCMGVGKYLEVGT
ncbi:hypothetical protein Bbelb_040170 [Branchiostoma belcheri]|nr:hypothetical protein Bbelb_040170 [Branchiostoma belcheri]